ncbi:hypothetical protein BDZ97DRAFT_1925729 [Flammula alnicola]|nr:hypothetical protein BDZ97DRAFT_1925729 [Flammula alnicola]
MTNQQPYLAYPSHKSLPYKSHRYRMFTPVARSKRIEFRSSSTKNVTPRSEAEVEKERVLSAVRASPATAARHNAMQPISKLSPEVLGLILLMVQEYPTTFPHPRPGSTDENQWLETLQVCRYFWDVAHGWSALWQHITMDIGHMGDHVALMRYFLKYSKSTKLYVRFTIKTASDFLRTQDLKASCEVSTQSATVIELLRENAHRIASLHIWDSYYLRDHLWQLLDAPWPSLTDLFLDLASMSFTIHGREYSPESFAAIYQSMCAGMPVILQGDTSRITQLALSGICHFPLNKFGNVTHLSLRKDSRRSLDPLSMSSSMRWNACPFSRNSFWIVGAPDTGRS